MTIAIFRSVTCIELEQHPLPGYCRRLARSAIFITAGLAVLSTPSFAKVSCSLTATAPVQFGVYDVLSPSDNLNGVGSIRINCKGGGGSFAVSLSTGEWSTSYVSRRMKLDGLNYLNYNLYTKASRSLVWGDGTGGSRTMTVPGKADTTLYIYGKIPLGQDVSVGTYVDSISATVTF